MRLAVITPVGPGHGRAIERARKSVAFAEKCLPSRHHAIRHVVIDDQNGRLGRSRARNIGMDQWDKAEWFFFLDADDRMRSYALTMLDREAPATFGAVALEGRVTKTNLWPLTWQDIGRYGANGTLSMGCFVRADIARKLRFNENKDWGEDFEFYLRLPGFHKIHRPLVDIGRKTKSAGGPRGYKRIDWTHICNLEIVEAWKNDPAKFGVNRDALLEKARRADPRLDAVVEALS